MKPRYHIEVLLGCGFDIWLHCYFMAGLIELVNEGTVRLVPMRREVRKRCEAFQKRGYPLFSVQCSDMMSGKSKLLVFDARDQSDQWQTEALKQVDVYFKRSFFAPDREELEAQLREKIYPMNPMFATWASGSVGWSYRLQRQFLENALKQALSPATRRSGFQDLVRSVRNFSSLSSLDEYEDTPDGEKRPHVLFQTRLWDPSLEEGDWVAPCNVERIELIRALRNDLGDDFIGGLVPTPYAREHHPDLLSNLTPDSKCKRPEFIRLCREFLIRVNIRALFHAIPYSLGETLAANNVMVSRTVRNSCESPLVEGTHYMGFTTPDECAAICRSLLDDPDKVRSLRAQSHEYYRTAVQPKEAMRHYLSHAMGSTGVGNQRTEVGVADSLG
jgi:hypothetical protein